MEEDKTSLVLNNEIFYEKLFFYQKAEVLYALTFHFTTTYLSPKGDRTVDQMVQAARSGKQNIIEAFADGVTSSELQLKLLNVARSSLKELRADYEDYIQTRHLTLWQPHHPRYKEMLIFCRNHNKRNEYEPYFDRWNAEELCNVAVTVLHLVDKMMMSYLKKLEEQFVKQGGMKERMHAARTGYRKGVDEELERLRTENKVLRQRVPILEQKIEELLREKRHIEVLLQQERMKRR
jgi:four helix bundle suffix protein